VYIRLFLSILDAISVAIPMIASRTDGIPEVVREGKTGMLAEPKNPDSLAKAIIFAHARAETIQILGSEYA